jgi:DNA-binding transcriptional ArsR family regulator
MSLEVSALRARAHPVRLRMLSLLTGSAMSAAELARELGLTQANASYHLRALVRAGLVRPAGQERVRGGMAKRYRYEIDAPSRADVDPEAEALFAEALATELVRRSQVRRSAGRGTTADAELWVEPEVWERVRAQVADAMRELHVQAQAPRRQGTTRVSVTVAMFELEDVTP